VLALSLGQHTNIALALDTIWVERFALGLQQAYAEDAMQGDLSQLTAIGVDIRGFYAHFGEAINRLLLGPYLQPITDRPSELTHTWRDFGRADRGNAGALSSYRPSRWVDGSYTHTFNVFVLQRLFPAARFIHVVRHVNEVVTELTSRYSATVYKSRHVPFTPLDAYEHWIDAVAAGIEAERAFGSDTVLRILRADLMTDAEAVLRRCLKFLDEPFDPQCLRPFRAAFEESDTVSDTPPSIEVDNVPAETRTQAEVLSFALLTESRPTRPRPPDQSRAARLEQEFVARSEKSI
jgi:hypothetical protein